MTDIGDTPQILTFDFQDLPGLVGRTFASGWMTVAAEKLQLFDAATYVDQNELPFDDGLYPDDMIEGFHLLAMLDHLSNPVLRLTSGPISGWNYGFDKVRFVSPVQVGDPIRLSGVVAEVTPRGDDFVVLLDCRLDVADRDRPALVAQWRVLWTAPHDR